MSQYLEITSQHSLEGVLLYYYSTTVIQLKCAYSNHVAKRLFSNPEITGQKLVDTLNWGESTAEYQKLASKLTQGLRFQMEMCSPSGTWVETHWTPHVDADGIEYWVVILKETQEKRHFQDSIMRISDQLNMVVRHAPILLWSIDLEGRLRLVEGKMLEGLVEPDKLVFDVFKKQPAFCRELKKAIIGEIDRCVADLGGRYLEFHFGSLYDAGGQHTGVIAVGIDITERVENERKLIEAKDKAEAATRAKSEFLANMSHEIRTPLNGILGFSEILSQQTEDPKLLRYTEGIATSGKNLLRLINDILDLSKIEAGKLDVEYQPTAPAEILREIETLFRFQSDAKSLDLKMEHNLPADCYLMLDATRLRQVLFNLVGNAVKYTQKGYVELRSELVEESDGMSTLVFEIEDTGVGISKEDRHAIFDAFTQKHSKAGGVGLGLSITQRLVDMMGGEISVESSLGKGSTFTVKLKEVIEAQGGAVEEDTGVENLDFMMNEVLVVDDLEMNIEILSTFLLGSHIRVIQANSGEEAIEILKNRNVGLVLMDLKMPGMSGFDTLKYIREDLKSSVPVVAITAHVIKEAEGEVYSAGFDGFLRKPISRMNLLKEVKKHMDYQELEAEGEIEESISEVEDSPESMAEVYAFIEREQILSRWEEIRKSSILGEHKSFHELLDEHLSGCGVHRVEAYLANLKGALDSYDIERVHGQVEEFENLVKGLAVHEK